MAPPDQRETPERPAGARELDLILERDPTGVYAVMDATTRERYRRVCQELALWSKKTPLEVAHEAIQLSAEHEASDERGRHVGAWLLAEGRPRLEARLGCHVPWRERASRLLRRHATNLYVGTLFVLLGLSLLGVERLLAARGIGLPHRVLLPAFLTVLLVDFLQQSLDRVLARLGPEAQPLPRLDPKRVLSRDTRTLVVTPVLVTRVEDIESQLRMMEINYLGNVEPEVFFALLTDFRDAPVKEEPGERELLERMEQGIRELNERHGYREQPRFYWLHRERRWNPVAGRWMGWERKRGKLEEFNRLVLGARDTSYTGPVPELVRTVRYALTLDADTHLLPGGAARMVATLHHPLNRARFDASGRKVIAGYSLLQPNAETGPTRTHWLVSGGWPLSIARERKRDEPEPGWALQQRLFGFGDFLGKGLYDVAAFTRSLENWIPENAILSHDRFEGMFARVVFARDIRLFENQPQDLTIFARIWHRWIRGDWQLLPWVLPWVPTRDGRRVANPLSLFDRWKLLAEINRSLINPSVLLLLVYGWLWLPSNHVWAWTLGVMLWMNRQQLVFAVVQTARATWNASSLMERLRTLVSAVPRILIGFLMSVLLLLPSTGLVLDAVIRVLYRLAFDRSRMLDWTTNAQAHRDSSRGRFWSLLARPEINGAAVLAVVLLGTLAAFNPWALPWTLLHLFGWMPVAVLAYRQRPAPKAQAVPPSELEHLRALARDAWEHQEKWAPTGEAPAHGETELTPTDLALGLVAPMSAYHLDYLELGGLVSRLGESLGVIAGLERHRGHLFERYDLRERRPVGARHVSTAESGVLAAALLIVESGLRAARVGVSDEELRARVDEVEARARALREEMDFAFLYDSAAGLLHVGYDVESRTLDDEHHGLLTSGAMLAGFVAIARNQLPLRHWVALAESDQRLRAAGALTTGQSTLADHLLPSLFLWYPPRTLLAQAALATVDAGLGARDAEPSRPASVAPHLSLLTWRFRPEHALANLRNVAGGDVAAPAGEGAGPLASPDRKQAITLAAVANLACDDILVQHFHQHWQTAWVEALVYETKDNP